MTPFGAPLRAYWDLDPGVTFLNHGSFGACPREVRAAQRRWQDALEAEPVRFFVDEAPGAVRVAAGVVASFLGADPGGLVFVDNATTGAGAVIASFDWGPSDAVVTTSHVYGAVAQALKHHAGRRGAAIVHADVPFPVASPDEVVDAVTRALAATPNARLLVVDHVTSFSGLVWPIEALVAAARAAHVPILVDGAHAPGLIPVDLGEIAPDFWTGNLHKWLFAPKGSAVLWIAPGWRERIHAPVISHGYGRGLHAEFDFLGTRDPSPWLAAPDALAFFEALGAAQVRAYQRALCEAGVALLTAAWGVEAPAPASMRAAMATLPLPLDIDPTLDACNEVRRRLLDLHGIEVPVFPWGGRVWLRTSAQVYNDLDDYRRLAAALGEGT